VNFGIRSFVCAPLLLPDRAIGTLYLDHRHAERAFNAADAEFLMAFAGFAAVTIDNALRQGRVLRRAKQLAREVEFLWDPAQIVAVSAVMGRVLADIRRVAPGTATVLVRGESGTGKELVARMLHGCSDRAEEPFVVVNCAAIPAGLVESELFGVVRGAATDVVDRAGKFEDAHGGTLFLDEIGELPAAAQAKILRAIQERCVDRIGGTQSIPVDFRLVAATNADLETALDAGTFRRDLYYRLRVIEITIPPLRDRREDIAPLIAYYVDHFSQALNRPKPEISERALRSYLAYAWPGNVRELRNAVERAVLFAEGTTLPELGAAASGVDVSLTVDGAFAARLSEREMRNRYARHVYEQLGRNKLRTCAFLGIDFKTLQQRLTPSA
jgi:transcriptional regulator with PAS, ATPase and Fis domain